MLSYNEIALAVAELELGIGAAELHGSLMGFLLGGGLVTPGRWLDDLLIEAPPVSGRDASRAALDAMALAMQLPAQGSSSHLTPLLPDVTLPLRQRAQALTEWCGGFLGGLGITGAVATFNADPSNADPVTELLSAIARIAGTRWPKASTPRADAVHFDEVVEFLDTALATLAEELPRAARDTTRGGLRH